MAKPGAFIEAAARAVAEDELGRMPTVARRPKEHKPRLLSRESKRARRRHKVRIIEWYSYDNRR